MRSSVVVREMRSRLTTSVRRQNTSSYKAVNEPVLDYAKNSSERTQIEAKLNEYMKNASKIRNDQREALFDVPIVIGDKEVSDEV